MTILILLFAIGVGFLVGDCKEFLFRDGLNNELAYILFKMIFTVLFCEINAILIFLNIHFQKYEKALISIQQSKEKVKEKIKIENHTHDTFFLPLEKEIDKEVIEEQAEADIISESVKPTKGARGRSKKKFIK